MKASPQTRSNAKVNRRSGARIGLRLRESDPRGLPTIILFQRGSTRLQRSYEDALRRHVLYLQAFGQTDAGFVLRGHANLRTNEPGAVSLSRKRAAAVANCLRALGVPASRIKLLAQGSDRGWDVEMGGRNPLKWNRRVEITINLGDASTTGDVSGKSRTRLA